MKSIATCFLCLVLVTVANARADDRTTYDEGSRPKVLINWQSFEDEGFPSAWKTPFTNLVINGYTRINRVIGVDIRPQFFGYTTKFDSDPGEIVISANEKHAASNRLASTFGFFPDRLKIVFHRKRGSDLTLWNWTPYWPNPTQYSMYAVLMHEMLHTLGLDHAAGTKTIMGGYGWTSHMGPWSGDIDDLRALYGLRESNRLRQLATTDGGATWHTLGNTVTNLGHHSARTTHEVAAAGNEGDATYIVAWVSPNNRLTWIRGNGVSFDTDTWQIFGGGPEVMFGTAMASDDVDTNLWTLVDTANDERRVKVIRTNDDGDTWGYVNFPLARTYGRPGLATTMVDGSRAWIVVWATYDEGDRDETGYLYSSVSFNAGTTWSSPQRVNSFYRLHDGVSISCNDTNDCMLSFVWAGERDTSEHGQNKIRSMRAHVDASNNQLVTDGTCYQSQHSRMAPGIAWHEGAARMVLGIREQDFATSLDSMQATTAGCPTGYQHISGSTTHVAPGLASNSRYNETVMWSARE